MRISLFAHWDATTNVRAAQAWEREGIDGMWIDESLWGVGALPLATACASVTERMRIGIGIVTPYTAHPSYLAMHYGTLVEMSGGRAVLGLGSGVESCLRQISVDARLPRTAVRESIEIMRAMLTGEKASLVGKRFSANAIELDFTPGAPAPLFWGAMGDRTIGTCGEVADGWIVSIMEPAKYVQRGVRTLRTSAADAGRDPISLEVVQFQAFACDDDSDVAKVQAKELIAKIARDEFGYFMGMNEFVNAFVADLEDISKDDYLAVMRRLAAGAPPSDAIPDTLVEQVAIAGNPEECVDKLRRFEAIGVTEMALKPATADLAGIARIVGDEIAPRLKSCAV